MKYSPTMVFGAALIVGGWASAPGVAFADKPSAHTVASTPAADASSADQAPSGDGIGACHATAHAHGSTCTCARCTSGDKN